MKKPKHKHKSPGGPRIAAAAPALRVDKKMEDSKTRKPLPDVTPTDESYGRNFTKAGKPKLSATSGEGAMGQRR